MPLGINDKDRIGSDRRSFFRMVKGSDRIADPFLTKGSGSDRRSRKKGSSNSLDTCMYLHNNWVNYDKSLTGMP